MSFKTQRLANYLPIWTKARADPSSLTQRFFDTFANMLDEQAISAIKVGTDTQLLKHYLGRGNIWFAFLSDEDQFRTTETSPGVLTYTYPTVYGTSSAVERTLVRYTDIVSMFNAAPDRLLAAGTQSFSSQVVWASASPFAYTAPPRPERLVIEVSGSTFYVKKTAATDRAYSGRHAIQIVGTDENNIQIREVVDILDDSVVYTRNIFKTVTEVTTEGFDGTCVIRWFPAALSYEPDPWRTAVFDDFEGQLRLSLTSQVVGATTYSYLVYSSNRIRAGEDYRRPEMEAFENNEILAEEVLLDSSNQPYIAVDLAINHENSKLYVLDDQGVVHVYDHKLSSFNAFSLTEVDTYKSYMELVPLRHRAKYGDTEYLYTDFRRTRFNANKIQIKRRAPDGTVRYLQADKTTWGAVAADIVAIAPDAATPESSWQDFRFQTEYDQLGQWEYALTLTTQFDTTVFTTAVQVGQHVPESSIDTGVSSPTALGFSKEGWVAVSTASVVNYFKEVVDGWIADTRANRILIASEYDSVRVEY